LNEGERVVSRREANLLYFGGKKNSFFAPERGRTGEATSSFHGKKGGKVIKQYIFTLPRKEERQGGYLSKKRGRERKRHRLPTGGTKKKKGWKAKIILLEECGALRGRRKGSRVSEGGRKLKTSTAPALLRRKHFQFRCQGRECRFNLRVLTYGQ